jgi:hypothetical protein
MIPQILPLLAVLILVLLSSSCRGGKVRERAYLPTGEGEVEAIQGEWVTYTTDRGPLGEGEMRVSIPADESSDAWSRMITIQFIDGLVAPPNETMERLLADYRDACPDLIANTVLEAEGSVLFEWSVDRCPATPDQHELVRVMQGQLGTHRVAFTKRGTPMSPEMRDAWVGRLWEAKVFQGQTKPEGQ